MNDWQTDDLCLRESQKEQYMYILVNRVLTNDSYSGGCLGRIFARMCVSTRGDVVHVLAHSEGRARKPSSNSRTGDLEC